VSQRRDKYAFDFPTTVANGVAQSVADMSDKWFQVVGLTGTADLEGTIDGTTWVKLITGIANGIVVVTQGVMQLRIARTGNGAGSAFVAGLARSD
jgi:hypothetical protein